jgi:hypothetical protein
LSDVASGLIWMQRRQSADPFDLKTKRLSLKKELS